MTRPEPPEQLTTPVTPQQQEDRDRQQPYRQAAEGGRESHVEDDALDLLDRRGRVAGDQRVALDQLLDRPDLGLAERQRDAERADVAEAQVGQQRPGLDHGVARQRGAYDGVVADQHDGPTAVEEQRHRHDEPESHAADDQHGTDDQPRWGEPHRYERACEIA